MKLILLTLLIPFAMLIGWTAGSAQTATATSPDPGVQPNRLIDRDEVRVSRIELEAGAVRSVHAHTDVSYQLFIPLTDGIRLTLDSRTIETHAGQAYFMAKGTPHGFANPGQSQAAVIEVFVKPSPPSDDRR
jgi:quercetin dioxygenase-like cupin family protein